MEHHLLEHFRFCPACGSPRFEPHNQKSKQCPQCGFTYYFNPSAATVAVILNERDELLVVRRAKQPARGTLDLPGGFCDCYETAEQGVCREVLEETGLSVCQTRYLFSIPNIYPYGGMDIHTMDLFFLCRLRQTDGGQAADDAAQLMWLPLEQVRPEDLGLTSVRQGVELLLQELPLISNP